MDQSDELVNPFFGRSDDFMISPLAMETHFVALSSLPRFKQAPQGFQRLTRRLGRHRAGVRASRREPGERCRTSRGTGGESSGTR